MIQFILNNTQITTSENAGITLLDFIREQQQLKGTKIGCREGDCGACTILVGELKGNTIEYQSITSCISPLGNAHGKHIVSIEGINLSKKLTTVQNAMAHNFATQCGFCTPGFVVSMTGFSLETSKEFQGDKKVCNDAISGNICRCTGYKSIEKAGLEIEEKLTKIDQENAIQWLISEGFIPDYFETIPKKLLELKNKNTTSKNKKGTIVANGTDLYVRHADSLSEKKVHLIADKDFLKGIHFKNETFTIGVNTTVTELLENTALRKNIPNLKAFIKLISSEQIRNMGTLGGNFVNASPIGDMSIFFLALNSNVTIQHKNGSERTIPFQEFHQDYKKYDLQKKEILKSISFQKLNKNTFFNFEKVCKRTHLDIASVNSAGKIEVENNIILQAHFSLGGVAAIPKYVSKTCTFLIGKRVNSETVKNAVAILQSEISPISDVRGTETYKRLLAKQLFWAHFIVWFPQKIKIKDLIVSV